MNKRLMIGAVGIAILLVGVGAVSAQGNGNGNNGNGLGSGNAAANGSAAYGSGYRNGYGAVTIVEPETGQAWNRQQQASRGQMGLYATLPPAVDGPLSDEVIAAMTDGINDERAAYAVYQSVMEQYGDVQPFANIMDAEAQHMTAWEFMFDRYGVELPPETAVDVPSFASVADACQFAAEAEINNMSLYDDMMTTFADYPDLLQVATALRNVSNYSHLPAFENCAS